QSRSRWRAPDAAARGSRVALESPDLRSDCWRRVTVAAARAPPSADAARTNLGRLTPRLLAGWCGPVARDVPNNPAPRRPQRDAETIDLPGRLKVSPRRTRKSRKTQIPTTESDFFLPSAPSEAESAQAGPRPESPS